MALNCVANGKVLKDGRFDQIWIQPAAGDAGGALGAALVAYHLFNDGQRVQFNGIDGMSGSYLGPEYGEADISERLQRVGGRFTTLDESELLDQTVQGLAEEKAVGWFQGRMEFGPRALGARSILADPRSPSMQKTLNLQVKFRECFRPFAPSVLREDVADWFEMDVDSPYMLLVADVVPSRRRLMTRGGARAIWDRQAERAALGDSGGDACRLLGPRPDRPQGDESALSRPAVARFSDRTGCPVLVNTSFNVRGEPIVCTPEDAFRCFMGTDIELLVVGNCLLRKEDQDPSLRRDYKDRFEID